VKGHINKSFIRTALLTAILDRFPILFPLFAPREFAVTNWTNLGR
jgi:hypothetical protein